MKMPDAVKTPNAVKIPDAVKMIVVPCYNEAARLQTHSFAEALGFDPNLRFQFVDDGSSDGTRAVLDELCDAFPGRCVAQSLPANRGKAEAVRQGMIAAFASDAEFVGYWDADLATPLSQLSRMIDALKRDESLDIVLGSRVRLLGRHIDRSGHRHVAGRIFATFSSLALRIPVYDTQCGAKVFRATKEIAAIFAEPFQSNWAFDVEWLARYLVHCQRNHQLPGLLECPLDQWRDVGNSSVKLVPAMRAFIDVFRIGLEHRRKLRVESESPAKRVQTTSQLPTSQLPKSQQPSSQRNVPPPKRHASRQQDTQRTGDRVAAGSDS